MHPIKISGQWSIDTNTNLHIYFGTVVVCVSNTMLLLTTIIQIRFTVTISLGIFIRETRNGIRRKQHLQVRIEILTVILSLSFSGLKGVPYTKSKMYKKGVPWWYPNKCISIYETWLINWHCYHPRSTNPQKMCYYFVWPIQWRSLINNAVAIITNLMLDLGWLSCYTLNYL